MEEPLLQQEETLLLIPIQLLQRAELRVLALQSLLQQEARPPAVLPLLGHSLAVPAAPAKTVGGLVVAAVEPRAD